MSAVRFMLLLAIAFPLYAQNETQPATRTMPDPLTLEGAISLLDEAHPDLARARLKMDRYDYDRQDAENLNAVEIVADARARWVEHREPPPQFEGKDDHRLGLRLSKPLYDSGYSDALLEAARLGSEAASLQYVEARDQHAIKVMRNYFEVILADLEATKYLEAMATDYVRLDRARDRHELGQLSDIELQEIDSIYQDTRRKLYESEGKARSTRVVLALSMNKPGQAPSRLLPPELKLGDIKLLPYEEILEKVIASNRAMQSMNHQLQAAHAKVSAARAKYKPTVMSEIERAEYERLTASADKWRVGIELRWPLYDGGRSDAAVGRAQLSVTEATLDIQQIKMRLHRRVRELWELVRVLQAEGDASKSFKNFRELYLDRSRTLYELEVKTDLGDSMVQISHAHLRSAQQQFQLALALAELNALAGKPIMDWKALAAQEPSG